MKERIIKWLVAKYLPGMYLARKPGPRKIKPVVWRENVIEDARDIEIEINKGRKESEQEE